MEILRNLESSFILYNSNRYQFSGKHYFRFEGDQVAVYPTTGWWKTRPALERYDKAARYALVVSIKAPEVDVDLCTEVANRTAVGVDAGL